MKTAILRADDKMRFEVHSSPARAGASIQKWFIKGMLKQWHCTYNSLTNT
jgi:hypothetical protein